MENKVTVKEAAAILGVSPRRVHALIEDGRIPVERFGNVFAINESDLALVSDRKAGRPKKEGAAEGMHAEPVSTSEPTKKAPATITPAKKRAIAAEQRERWLAGAPGKKSPAVKSQVMKRGGKKY